ncbi:MAG: hypothetical protein NTZ80_01250 [Patescibacteria group bacterium]|nr:hypothetical protein [Patescibacteria group bacterium]
MTIQKSCEGPSKMSRNLLEEFRYMNTLHEGGVENRDKIKFELFKTRLKTLVQEWPLTENDLYPLNVLSLDIDEKSFNSKAIDILSEITLSSAAKLQDPESLTEIEHRDFLILSNAIGLAKTKIEYCLAQGFKISLQAVKSTAANQRDVLDLYFEIPEKSPEEIRHEKKRTISIIEESHGEFIFYDEESKNNEVRLYYYSDERIEQMIKRIGTNSLATLKSLLFRIYPRDDGTYVIKKKRKQ